MAGRKTVRKRASKLAESELFEYSVRYLSQRACSTEELRSKLRMKAARLEDVTGIIDRLKEIGYLDDRRFAEGFALNRAENDGFGRMRVLSDLRGRRIAPALAEKTVAQVYEDKDESGLIDAFIERRMPPLARATRIEDQKELAKAYRRLRRAGFSAGGSIAALKRRAARPEEVEEPAEEEESPEDAM
jgi:regulatory protein